MTIQPKLLHGLFQIVLFLAIGCKDSASPTVPSQPPSLSPSPYTIAAEPGKTWTYAFRSYTTDIWVYDTKSLLRSGIHQWELVRIDSGNQNQVYHFLSHQVDTVRAQSKRWISDTQIIYYLDTTYTIIQQVPFDVTISADSVFFMWGPSLQSPTPYPLLYPVIIMQESQVFPRTQADSTVAGNYQCEVTYFNRTGIIDYSLAQYGRTGGVGGYFKLIGPR